MCGCSAPTVYPPRTRILLILKRHNVMAYRSPEQMVSLLQGVFAFPVTPFHPDGSLNVEALRHHVRNLLDTGVSAIFACAGTGEFFSLAPEEYREAVTAVV